MVKWAGAKLSFLAAEISGEFGNYPELRYLRYKSDQHSEDGDKAAVIAAWTLTLLLVTYAVSLDTIKTSPECWKMGL